MFYDQLLHADPGAFDEAASAFKGFEADVRDRAIDYNQQVLKHLNDEETWRGEAARAAKVPMGDLQLALNRAADQLDAVPTILRDHAERLSELKARLKGIVANASEAGIQVQARAQQITVTAPVELKQRSKDANWPDPEGAVLEDIRTVLNEATELDMKTAENLREALTAESLDAHDVGAEYRDAVKDARRAAALLDKLQNDPFNDEYRSELIKLLNEHGEDSEFAATLLKKLGGRGAMEALQTIAVMGNADPRFHGGGDRPPMGDLRALQKGLGGVLALGTNPGSPFHIGDDWMKEFQKAGKEQFGVGLGEYVRPYGYQLLGSILHSGEYSSEFLNAVGSDMIEMDRDRKFEGERPFALNGGFGRLNFIDGVGAGFDPLNGLMMALEDNPPAAKEFFDPDNVVNPDAKPGDQMSRIEYLLDRKDWADLSYSDATTDTSNDSSQSLVIDALAAASDGAQPGNNKGFLIATETINHLGEAGGHGLNNDQSRESMAELLKGQMGAVNDSLGEGGRSFDPGAVSRILGDVAHSPEAYANLANAERAYYALRMEQITDGFDPSDPDSAARVRGLLADEAEKMGRLMAHINHGKEDAIQERWDGEAHDYNARVKAIGEVGSYAIGKALKEIPGVDLLLGPAIDNAVENAQVNYQEYADADIARLHDKDHSEPADMVEQLVWENGLYDTDRPVPKELLRNGYPIPIADMTDGELAILTGWKAGNEAFQISVQRTLDDIGDAYPNGSTTAKQSQGGGR